MKNLTFLCCCMSALFFGCKSPKMKEYEFETKKIQWNLNRDFEIKDIVQDIQYIMLEDSPESFFYEISKLVVLNDRIYILDSNSPALLLVFDITGKFLHKIGRQGNGPGEYVRFINFAVDKNDEVFMYDLTKRNIMKFDKHGKYLHSTESSFALADLVCLPDNQFLLSLDNSITDNINRKVILTDDFKKAEKTFFCFHKNFKDNKFNVVTFQPYGNRIAYMHPINDTLFIFDNKGTPEQAWFFDFGNKKLAENLKNDYIKAVEEEKQGNKNSIYIYEAPVCIKSYIFATMMVSGQRCISVYDMAKDQIAYEILKPETFSLYNINSPLYALSDSVLISWFSTETYMFVKDEYNFSINSEADAHLENGGTLLLFNTIR